MLAFLSVAAFAELKDPVKDRLERYGLNAKAFVGQTGVPWVDWEEPQ